MIELKSPLGCDRMWAISAFLPHVYALFIFSFSPALFLLPTSPLDQQFSHRLPPPTSPRLYQSLRGGFEKHSFAHACPVLLWYVAHTVPLKEFPSLLSAVYSLLSPLTLGPHAS